jgi:hypothetical protein
VERIIKGVYEVHFIGNPAAIAVATVAQDPGAELTAASASVELLTNGVWWVNVYDLRAKENADLPFSMILP